MKKTLIVFMAMFILVFMVSSCMPAPTPTPTPNLEGELISVREGTVSTFGDLRIGGGWIRKSDYVDDNGEKRHGLIAGLAMELRGEEKDVNGYEGQSLQFGEYVIHVEEINDSFIGSGYVVLRIEER